MPDYDAIVVGAGPNGLAAAITPARAGWKVLVREAKDTVGGGTRTEELTLPGYWHDVCSAIHALGVGAPLMTSLPLAEHGLEWIHPDVPLAHPFDDGTAALLSRSIEATGQTLGQDAAAYRRVMAFTADHWDQLAGDLVAPWRFPRPPCPMARVGVPALLPSLLLAKV